MIDIQLTVQLYPCLSVMWTSAVFTQICELTTQTGWTTLVWSQEWIQRAPSLLCDEAALGNSLRSQFWHLQSISRLSKPAGHPGWRQKINLFQRKGRPKPTGCTWCNKSAYLSTFDIRYSLIKCICSLSLVMHEKTHNRCFSGLWY